MADLLEDLEVLARFDATNVPDVRQDELACSLIPFFGPLILDPSNKLVRWPPLRAALQAALLLPQPPQHTSSPTQSHRDPQPSSLAIDRNRICAGWAGLSCVLRAFRQLEAVDSPEHDHELVAWLRALHAATIEQSMAYVSSCNAFARILSTLRVPPPPGVLSPTHSPLQAFAAPPPSQLLSATPLPQHPPPGAHAYPVYAAAPYGFPPAPDVAVPPSRQLVANPYAAALAPSPFIGPSSRKRSRTQASIDDSTRSSAAHARRLSANSPIMSVSAALAAPKKKSSGNKGTKGTSCVACVKGKVKCERPTLEDVCTRCEARGIECSNVQSAWSTSPNVRASAGQPRLHASPSQPVTFPSQSECKRSLAAESDASSSSSAASSLFSAAAGNGAGTPPGEAHGDVAGACAECRRLAAPCERDPSPAKDSTGAFCARCARHGLACSIGGGAALGIMTGFDPVSPPAHRGSLQLPGSTGVHSSASTALTSPPSAEGPPRDSAKRHSASPSHGISDALLAAAKTEPVLSATASADVSATVRSGEDRLTNTTRHSVSHSVASSSGASTTSSAVPQSVQDLVEAAEAAAEAEAREAAMAAAAPAPASEKDTASKAPAMPATQSGVQDDEVEMRPLTTKTTRAQCADATA